MPERKGKAAETGRARKSAEAGARRAKRLKRRSDFDFYRFSKRDILENLLLFFALDGCISYLFFNSFIAFVLLLPGAILFFRERKKSFIKSRKQEIIRQFLDAIQMMSASLQAGYSAENALSEAQKELVRMYPPDAVIVREFSRMEAQIRMSRNLEALFLDFGRKTEIADIISFAEVFLTAKRSGGDLLAIIRNTVNCIRQKQETTEEIETSLSGKIMEQNVMSVIPILILAYVRLTSPEFLDVMYGSVMGIGIMCICFLVYVAAYLWGQSILAIEV